MMHMNISINKYLVLIWFAYLSTDNNFHANGAINNNEYCSITKKHTMCTPEVRMKCDYDIQYSIASKHPDYIALKIHIPI